jgi:hypothetical protein
LEFEGGDQSGEVMPVRIMVRMVSTAGRVLEEAGINLTKDVSNSLRFIREFYGEGILELRGEIWDSLDAEDLEIAQC